MEFSIFFEELKPNLTAPFFFTVPFGSTDNRQPTDRWARSHVKQKPHQLNFHVATCNRRWYFKMSTNKNM